MNKTEYLKLKQPEEDDFFDVEHQNGNMQLLDAELKKQNEELENKAENSHTHDLNAMINTLPSGESVPIDSTNIITQYPIDKDNHTYTRRPISTLWSYIKAKADRVYAAVSHKHTRSDITDFPTTGAGLAMNGEEYTTYASLTELTSTSQLTHIGEYYVPKIAKDTGLPNYSVGDFRCVLLAADDHVTVDKGCSYGTLYVTSPRTSDIWACRIWDYKFYEWTLVNVNDNGVVGRGSTGTTNPWYLIGEFTNNDTSNDMLTTLLVVGTYYNTVTATGILQIHIRTNNPMSIDTVKTELKWLSSNRTIKDTDFALCYKVADGKINVKLYCKILPAWAQYRSVVLDSGYRISNSKKIFQLYNLPNTTGIAELPSDYKIVYSEYADDRLSIDALKEDTANLHTSQGQNLIPYPYYRPDKYISNGITFTVNDDGSITANGTATATAYFMLHMGKLLDLEPGKTYTVSLEVDNGTASIYIANTKNNTNTDIAYVRNLKNSKRSMTFVYTRIDGIESDTIGIYIVTGSTLADCTIKVQLEEGKVAHAYQPTTSSNLTLKNAIVQSQGQNLIQYPYYSGESLTKNGITYTMNDDGSVTVDGSSEGSAYYHLMGGTLKLDDCAYVFHSDAVKGMYVYIYDITAKTAYNTTEGNQTITFIGNSSHVYDVTISVSKGTTVSNANIHAMLEKGTVPHQYQSPVLSNVSLRGAVDQLVTNPDFKNGISMGRNSSGGTGYMSVATGSNVAAIGYYSHAEGSGTTAKGVGSHAEGQETTANGTSSHAEGGETTASGECSHAGGFKTTALAWQYAIGHFNDTSLARENSISGIGTGSAFVIGNGTEDSKSNAFRVTGEGVTYAKGAYNATGADYAEYAEWADGNPDHEDRRGYFVTFDDDAPEKIRKANAGEYILGVISGNPCIIGNSDECWKGQYLTDEFDSFVYETKTETITHANAETGEEEKEEVDVTFHKVNPDYDPDAKYVQRADRKEWDAVGWIGVLPVRDDGTCVPGGYCVPADGGTATAAERGQDAYRVLSRVTENVVRIAIK